ncbi:MAG: maleylacetoacetate isomerase [Gammaproteobacteria bacterium]|nr:maleylacetoacetate isomerase [Gammaproteobacteria bacterium]
MIKLYSYWRSSAAYRVRIALNLKKLEHEIVPVNMLKDGGEQHSEAYKTINPQGLVPTLQDGKSTITQSLAILEYLEEKYPRIALLPADLEQKAKARQLAQIIACDIHPLDNLRVLKYLKNELAVSDVAKDDWYAHWIRLGFAAFESALDKNSPTGGFCLGDAVSIADLCLIPQMYNAHRFNINLDNFPRLCEIEKNCLQLQAFARASPEQQIDAI